MNQTEKNKSGIAWKGAFIISCIWFGTHVGPGFAGGAQIVSFFVSKGPLGVFVGPLLVMLLSAVYIYFLFEFG